MTVTAICEAVEEVTGSMPETWTSSVHRELQHVSTCWICQVTGHVIDWSNATVLDSCQFYYQRSYFESWHIHPITSQTLHFTITLQASQFFQWVSWPRKLISWVACFLWEHLLMSLYMDTSAFRNIKCSLETRLHVTDSRSMNSAKWAVSCY